MNAFVTGANGRLGNVVVRHLLEEGHTVRALVAPHHQDLKSLEGLSLDLIEGDIREISGFESALEGIDWVFHLAAKIALNPDRDGSMFAINTEATRKLAELCLKKDVGRFVYCSSHHALMMKPYNQPVDENRALATREGIDYHRTKALAEVEILQMSEKGLDAVIVNPGTLIGPYDFEPSIFAQAMIDFYKGKIPFLMEGLSDYADVRDVAQAIVQAAKVGKKGERYLLTGWMLEMKDVPGLVQKITGKKMPRRILPLWVMYALLPFIQLSSKLSGKAPLFTKDMLHASQSNPVISHEKARRELGYSPRSLEDTFGDAFAWYKEQGWI
ncbi:MAG: NAD-dependent epimerase/dehydratase family protein [Microscillaceae bacterium]|nr:NAD-dependent epimerase/dehydratase family protein [Microscillaceae bacterium]